MASRGRAWWSYRTADLWSSSSGLMPPDSGARFVVHASLLLSRVAASFTISAAAAALGSQPIQDQALDEDHGQGHQRGAHIRLLLAHRPCEPAAVGAGAAQRTSRCRMPAASACAAEVPAAPLHAAPATVSARSCPPTPANAAGHCKPRNYFGHAEQACNSVRCLA